MRFLIFLTCLLFPVTAQANCDGRDLRPSLSAQMQSELQNALADIPFPEGNHWIARKDGTVLHVIGTLHTFDARMGPVVEGLTPVLKQADAFYFEVTQDKMKAFEQGLAKDLSPIMLTSGPTLIDLLPAEDWAALSALLAERGIPGWMAAKMRPWFISIMLGFPHCLSQIPNGDYGMDARLTELADANGIPQFSLETIDELMEVFNSYPLEDQVQSLIKFSGVMTANADHLATATNSYLEEKHAEILQLARLQGFENADLTQAEFDAEWNEFENQLLVQRNNKWMKHILGIEDQTAVIAVGAGHLSDDHGLLNQLQQAGYTLTRAPF